MTFSDWHDAIKSSFILIVIIYTLYIQPFSESSDIILADLLEQSKVTNDTFKAALNYFGESQNTKAVDFFGLIAFFLHDFEVGM